MFPWTDNNNTLTLAFGTHTKLQLYQGGALYDVTPTLALPAITLGSNPIATTNTTPTIVVTQPGHPYIVGDSIVISGASAVATVTINGTWTITAVTADTWTFTAGSNANATTTGGGSAVVATPQRAFSGGQIDGTGSTGYGTGAYGIGGYGSPSATDYFPLTWDLAALGQTLIACPRDQTIFQWSNSTASPAAALAGAPAIVNAMIVARDFVFALGCSQEVGGVFNPLCVRHSDIRGPTGWSTVATSASTSREYILPGGGRIVSGREIGRSILVWTNHSLFLGTYVGQLNKVWQFDRVGANCGLIGPKAVVILGGVAYWISPDRQFHSYAPGGMVGSIPCPTREDFADNLAASQGDKVTASSIAEFNEIRFDYPDARDGYENSRYIAVCVDNPDAGSWSKGVVPRTAMVDAGPSSYPCGVTFGGAIYWHEKGNSADGAAFAWFIETADIYLDENRSVLTRGAWPDIADQTGPVYLTITTRQYPQGDGTVFGPYSMPPSLDKLDFKVSGRLYRLKFSGNSAPSSARIGRFTFDAKLRGRK